MNELMQVFEYEARPVRTVMVNGEPWFVARDACDILEIDSSQTRRLDDDEKGLRSIQTLGGMQEMLCVNEPGLYSLILGSRKPEARAFKRWITHEVIPQIRQTGVYGARIPRTLSEALRLAADQADQIEAQQQQIKLLTPAAEFGKTVGSSEGGILVRDFVKLLANGGIEIGQDKFFSWLNLKGYIYRQNGQWIPYRQFVDQGLFKVTERTFSSSERGDFIKLTLRISGKGQRYFHDKLKERTA